MKDRLRLLLLIAGSIILFRAEAQPPANAAQAGLVLTTEGNVEVARSGATKWTVATTNQDLAFGDSLRTGPRSRATVRLSDLSVLRINEKTVLEIRPQDSGQGSMLDLRTGSAYFFNRSKPSSLQFHTPLVSGAIRGTEFNLDAAPNGPTTVTLFEGEVALDNNQGKLVLQSGEQGLVEPGQAPRKTAVLNAINVIQWSLYYPAILDNDELTFGEVVRSTLRDSLSAYRAGDLLAALARYPEKRRASSDAERIYHAALLLSVGQVDQTEAELKTLESASSLAPASALLKLIASVKHEQFVGVKTPVTSSDWLAESYYLQSRSELNGALRAAQQAVYKSSNFGFGWLRLAELEFSMGHVERARGALSRGLELSPRNAQALALQGFVLASENSMEAAALLFDRAISVDGALANAWLGRGLCKLRAGQPEAGRQDLQVAATLEPNRADLRSYLGKAWAERRDRKHAEKELRLAKQLDPNDPTPWLYSALLHEAYNEENQAIGDLEKSKALNNNRSVYRSRFLLDQDQAVRGANLAKIYQDVGMDDWSAREAARSVDLDYANYSAHLFLANSYDALRDPRKANLRYETPWFSQLLVADLLAPVGAIPLSQNVSQQEYSRLFASDHLGAYSATEYLSRGAWAESASEYANIGNIAFSFDQYYRSDPGERANNDAEEFDFSARFKQQITSQDSVYFELNYLEYRSGDVLQYYDQNTASRTVRIKEVQDPNLFAGYHHEWGPGMHTLILVGRLADGFSLTDPAASAIVTTKNINTGQIVGVSHRPAQLDYNSDLTAHSAEVQQIFQSSAHTLVLGARYQHGDIDTDSFIQRSQPVNQSVSLDLNRISGYGYYSWQIFEPLLLVGGASYDYLKFPENNEIAPISAQETHQERFSPKAGIRWTPLPDTAVRGIYTRSLGGVFYDTSVRLEPTQIAGFNQAFRSLIPESVAGLVPGSRFETFGAAWDQKFSTRTYASVSWETLKSRASRTVGTLDAFGPLLLDVPSGVKQMLAYTEDSLTINLNQLLGDEFAVGANYRVSWAGLDDDIPAISPALSPAFSATANRDVHATLQQLDLYALFNHRSGFFAKVEGIWSSQANSGYTVSLAGDDFWQFNAFIGYRLPQRVAEVQLGLLNIGDRDYKLNPLNLYSELPRSRTLFASFKFNF